MKEDVSNFHVIMRMGKGLLTQWNCEHATSELRCVCLSENGNSGDGRFRFTTPIIDFVTRRVRNMKCLQTKLPNVLQRECRVMELDNDYLSRLECLKAVQLKSRFARIEIVYTTNNTKSSLHSSESNLFYDWRHNVISLMWYIETLHCIVPRIFRDWCKQFSFNFSCEMQSRDWETFRESN